MKEKYLNAFIKFLSKVLTNGDICVKLELTRYYDTEETNIFIEGLCQNSMKIHCIGQLVTDVLVLPVERVDYTADTILVDKIELNSGGDAMNVAINLARLGAEVLFTGRVGGDDFGRFLRRRLEEAGVDASGLSVNPDSQTDTCVAMINSKGDRTFLYAAGANLTLGPEQVSEKSLGKSGIVHIGGTFLLPGLDGEGAAEIFRRARRHGAITTMDVTHDTSNRWMGLIRPSLEHLDYFMPSVAEAEKITNRAQPEEMARVLLDAGVKTVVIKLGAKGCYVRNEREGFFQPAFRANAVDTTGAGDAFVAGFLYGLSKELPLRECAATACAAGAITVCKLGATNPQLRLELIKQIQNEGEIF